MERKLIKQGGGGYTIYLPKKWADKKGLKEGDNINITETETHLVIESAIKTKKEITVDITDEGKKEIKNLLTHIYRKGFDTIKLHNVTDANLSEIKKVTSDFLLGFEITDKDKGRCKIENISEPTDQKYDVLLRRIFLIIKETQDIIISDFKANKLKSQNEIEELKDLQEKYVLFCRRTLYKERREENLLTEWELLTFLLHIQHGYYYLYDIAAKYKVKSDAEIMKLLEGLKESFGLFYKSYFERDIKAIYKVNKVKTDYYFGKCLDVLQNSKGNKTIVVSHIREMFRWMQIGTSPIMTELMEEKI